MRSRSRPVRCLSSLALRARRFVRLLNAAELIPQREGGAILALDLGLSLEEESQRGDHGVLEVASERRTLGRLVRLAFVESLQNALDLAPALADPLVDRARVRDQLRQHLLDRFVEAGVELGVRAGGGERCVPRLGHRAARTH